MFSVGSLSEYGVGYLQMDNITGYSVFLSGATIYIPLFKTHGFFNTGTELYPHFGMSEFKHKFGHEFGLNARSRFNFAISPDRVISVLVGCGPHWLYIQTPRQAQGFLFSNNFLIAFEQRLPGGNQTIFFQTGWRHLSNLGLKKPNAGLNYITFGFGFRGLFDEVFD